MIRIQSFFAALLPLLFFASGCSYKIEIQQGSNALLDKADALEVGMSQEQVENLLGPPTTTRLFRKHIWIYIYQLRESGFIGDTRRRVVQLAFDDTGLLQEIDILQDNYNDSQDDADGADDAGS